MDCFASAYTIKFAGELVQQGQKNIFKHQQLLLTNRKKNTYTHYVSMHCLLKSGHVEEGTSVRRINSWRDRKKERDLRTPEVMTLLLGHTAVNT